MTRASFLALVFLIAWTLRASAAGEDALLAGLETEDPVALANAISAIERAPTTPELADVLFAAGRACEDRLHDPARALAIYERIVRELPDAGISIAAGRRMELLESVRDHGREAGELAQLIATADALARDEVVRRAEALIASPWPGAADAALWLADWSCRTARYAAAQARYTQVTARWPGSEHARYASRNAASCAIDAGDWPLAEQLADRLPAGTAEERAIRSDLLDNAERGRRRGQLYVASWVGLLLALAALLGSLADAMLRGGFRRPSLRPPIEVLFLAPVAALIVVVSLTGHVEVASAVLWISIAGVLLAWLSGAVLDLCRTRERNVRARSLLHALACIVSILAIGYIKVTQDGLLDMLAETVKFGPGS